MTGFIRIFIQGLIVFIPLAFTVYVLVKLFDIFSSFFSFINFTDVDAVKTVLGLVLTVTFIFLLGLLASSYIFKHIFTYFEEKLENAPFIRHIYSPVKDFTNAFMGNKRKFNRPVLVLIEPTANLHQIGFITNDDLAQFGLKDMVSVYLPLSYSLSGRLVIVPSSHIKPLSSNPAETMKFVVTGGVSDVE